MGLFRNRKGCAFITLGFLLLVSGIVILGTSLFFMSMVIGEEKQGQAQTVEIKGMFRIYNVIDRRFVYYVLLPCTKGYWGQQLTPKQYERLRGQETVAVLTGQGCAVIPDAPTPLYRLDIELSIGLCVSGIFFIVIGNRQYYKLPPLSDSTPFVYDIPDKVT